MSITITQLDKAIGNAERVKDYLDNPQPLMNAITVALHRNTLARFVRQVDPAGNPWIPSQRAIRQGGQTLRDYGILMNSIRMVPATANKAEIATELEYAAPHQLGLNVGRNRSVKLKVRQFIGYSDQDERDVQDEIERGFATRIR